jgi:hypothetical protein
MNDFNYYIGREIIPLVPNPSAVDRLLLSKEDGYLIIKARDLERLPQLRRQWVVLSDAKTNANWYLVQLRVRASQERS